MAEMIGKLAKPPARVLIAVRCTEKGHDLLRSATDTSKYHDQTILSPMQQLSTVPIIEDKMIATIYEADLKLEFSDGTFELYAI
jgi:hypothetical protein